MLKDGEKITSHDMSYAEMSNQFETDIAWNPSPNEVC